MQRRSGAKRKLLLAVAVCLACIAAIPAVSSAGTFTYVRTVNLSPGQFYWAASVSWPGISVQSTGTPYFCIGTYSSTGNSTCSSYNAGYAYIESVLGYTGLPWVQNTSPAGWGSSDFRIYKYNP